MSSSFLRKPIALRQGLVFAVAFVCFGPTHLPMAKATDSSENFFCQGYASAYERAAGRYPTTCPVFFALNDGEDFLRGAERGAKDGERDRALDKAPNTSYGSVERLLNPLRDTLAVAGELQIAAERQRQEAADREERNRNLLLLVPMGVVALIALWLLLFAKPRPVAPEIPPATEGPNSPSEWSANPSPGVPPPPTSLHEQALAEWEDRTGDRGLLAACIAEAKGNTDLAMALYIERRVESLQRNAAPTQIAARKK